MKKVATLVLALFAACGDGATVNQDAADEPGDGPTETPPRAVVAAGPFGTGVGVLSVLDVTTRTPMNNVGPAMAVGADPVMRKFDDELVVVNRDMGNNITILSATDYSLVEQLGTGPGTNPQDVAIAGQKIFVATYGNKGLVELTRGSSAIVEIDLSADDPDGVPNCASVYLVGANVYVACQLLDAVTYQPRGPGKVYVVSIATRTVAHELTLATENPFSLFERLPDTATNAGDLVIGTVNFGTGAGCIERVTTGGTPTAEGCLVDNATLGGNASRIEIFAPPLTGPVAGTSAIIPAPVLFALVPRPDYSGGNVRTFDLIGNAIATAPASMNQALGDVAVCPDGTWIASEAPSPPSTAPHGLRVYQGGTEVTTAPIAIGMKPASSRGLVCY